MTDTVTIKDEGNIIEVVQGRDLTVCKIVKSDLEIENVKFIQLADTPDNYVGSANKAVRVNGDETGLVFGDTYETFISLTDTPSSYSGNENKLVVVNNEGNGLSFVNYSAGDISIEYFTQLADTPASYQNAANKVASVKSTEDGLEFKVVNDLLSTQSINAGVYNYPIVTVNSKGIITDIENGTPFEFPPFTENNLLIGDGTKTPAEVTHGTTNQVLITTANTGAVAWNWLGSLYDSYGNAILQGSSQSDTYYNTLSLFTNSTSIKLYPANSATSLILGYGNEVTITQAYTTFDNDIKLLSGNCIEGESNIALKPVSTVQVDGSIDATAYANRIVNDNDFVTKKYLDLHQVSTENLLKRTASSVLTDNTLVYSLPINSETNSLVLNINQAFNDDVELLVQDSLGNILLDSNSMPSFAEVDLVVINFIAKASTSDYQITVSLSNYDYGSTNVYLTYF